MSWARGTLAELGKKVGDTVRIGDRPYTRTARITGVVTLPSFGLATSDHVSLGRGAMLSLATLQAAEGAAGGGQPIDLALGLAAAAVLSLALTVLGSVRRRRHELALLKALGMTRGQIRSVVAWQTTLTLLIAVAVGGPLGVAGGRLAWGSLAGSLGVVPASEVPVAGLIAGLLVLILAGNLLSAAPAAIAARTRPAIALRAE